jgi:hypothetical protein
MPYVGAKDGWIKTRYPSKARGRFLTGAQRLGKRIVTRFIESTYRKEINIAKANAPDMNVA